MYCLVMVAMVVLSLCERVSVVLKIRLLSMYIYISAWVSRREEAKVKTFNQSTSNKQVFNPYTCDAPLALRGPLPWRPSFVDEC